MVMMRIAVPSMIADSTISGPTTFGKISRNRICVRDSPATLVAVWWGDAFVYKMTAVPDNGFRVIDRFLELPPQSGVQCAVAVRQVDRAGTWRVTWHGSPCRCARRG